MSKVRVGIMLDSLNMRNWQYQSITQLIESKYAEIDVIILNKNVTPKKSFSSRFKKLLFLFYEYIDEKIFKYKEDVFEIKTLNVSDYRIPVIFVNPKRKKFTSSLCVEDIARVNNYKLDVMIRFGFGIIDGDILNTPKYGVWSFHHGDNRHYRGSCPAFWEMHNAEDTLGVTLQVLSTTLDGGRVLSRSVLKLDKISLFKNRRLIYGKSTYILTTNIEKLFRNKNLNFATKNLIDAYSSKLYRNPTNIETIVFISKLFKAVSLKMYEKIFFKYRWDLLVQSNNMPSVVANKFIRITSPKGFFWADPFIVSEQGVEYVFFEEYDYSRKLGHISVITLDALKNGDVDKKFTIIQESHHMSFPFIFKYDEKYFMMPECSTAGSIKIYESSSFPYEWKYKCNIFDDIRAWDPVLLNFQGKWWLFVNMANDNNDSNNDLYLFYKTELFNDSWRSHPMNPISTDIRQSRAAGRIFKQGVDYIRPSQDCGPRYGHSIIFNRILILNENEYKEEPVQSIRPSFNENIKGVHTFNFNENYVISDAFTRCKRF